MNTIANTSAKIFARASALFALLLLLVSVAPARAETISVETGGQSFFVPVSSFKQLRMRSVVLQRYDFSCGSAALATLLTWHYGKRLREEDVFQAMYQVGDQENIRRYGFSLLDMKSYLESIGLQADGFQVSLDKLEELSLPAIGLIEVKGYKHFVVIKGIRDGRVLFGDPARGLRAVDRRSFEAMWNGVVLLIRSDVATAQASFNPGSDWAAEGKAPLAQARQLQDVGTLLLNLRPGAQF